MIITELLFLLGLGCLCMSPYTSILLDTMVEIVIELEQRTYVGARQLHYGTPSGFLFIFSRMRLNTESVVKK